MRKLWIIFFLSTTVYADWREDYFNGLIDIRDFLIANPEIQIWEGPLQGQQYTNIHEIGGTIYNDKSAVYIPTLFQTVSDNETQFLSFELSTLRLFSLHSAFAPPGMHVGASLRGDTRLSSVEVRDPRCRDDDGILEFRPECSRILGRGLALGDTSGVMEGTGCYGVAIEDFATKHILPSSNNSGILGCKNYPFQDNAYATYRFDVHASKNYVSYWMFKRNIMLDKWELILSGGCSENIYGGGACPQHEMDNGANIIIGSAFRRDLPYGWNDYIISNVYTGKF
ncbi:hypothetical protein [Microbulbifer sp. TYP-18]|uniref:hypothetical protein n=1 Tax=Microbulbifer sp. TYP-18 TaxID=3230024 RepID=UPI0034C68795